jgi:arylsulfatase A-like enzyme
MTMRLTFLSLVLSLSAACSLAAERPNVVFFLADDLGSHDCGFNGGELKTPNLDKLAAAGAVLEQFYVQQVCSPTRGALMTGRYPMRLGLQVGVIRPWANYGLPLEERTLAQALREAGYTTCITGKWHLGSFDKAYWPNARGFDHAYGHLFGALDYFTHIRENQLDWYRNGEQLKEEGYSTHLIAKEAAGWVRQQDGSKPFFLYVPFNAVHTPLQVPESYTEPYANLPETRKKVAGMLAALDEAVGQIVTAVEEKGQRANTLFIFSSDNGGFNPGKATDNTPLRAGKGTLYEGGVRAAAFATWDGHIPSGTRLQQPLHIVNWYPTLLNLAGAKLDQPLPVDGRDMWGTLTRGEPSPNAEILLGSAPGKGAIRIGDWKLVSNGAAPEDDGEAVAEAKGGTPPPQPAAGGRAARRNAANTMELFNLADDPSEKTNLAKTQPDKLQELQARYNALAAEARTPLQEVSPPVQRGKGL